MRTKQEAQGQDINGQVLGIDMEELVMLPAGMLRLQKGSKQAECAVGSWQVPGL